MPTCSICKRDIEPRTAAVEFVGGLFDPEDPIFFVADESVMNVSHCHLQCLLSTLSKKDSNAS